MIAVKPIDAQSFSAFGVVLDPAPDGNLAAATDHWHSVAREQYGSGIKPETLNLPARDPRLGFIEAHPNSPQLSVAFDSPWILTVVPGIAPGTTVGRDADVSSAEAFLVPMGAAVILREGLWHGPVTTLRATNALVIFRDDVVDEWTELESPVPLDLPPGA